MIYEVGGGIPGGKKLKAVVPGGSSTLFSPPKKPKPSTWISIHFAKSGEFLGSGGVVVLDETDLHGEVRAAHHEILPARELRMVYSLP